MRHTYENSEYGHLSSTFKSRMKQHDRQHNDTPDGRNFATWNHPNFIEGQRKVRENFDSIFPDAPGAGI